MANRQTEKCIYVWYLVVLRLHLSCSDDYTSLAIFSFSVTRIRTPHYYYPCGWCLTWRRPVSTETNWPRPKHRFSPFCSLSHGFLLYFIDMKYNLDLFRRYVLYFRVDKIGKRYTSLSSQLQHNNICTYYISSGLRWSVVDGRRLANCGANGRKNVCKSIALNVVDCCCSVEIRSRVLRPIYT